MRTLIIAITLLFTPVGVVAQTVSDNTVPQPNRWYLACSSFSNDGKQEFRAAAQASSRVTTQQLRSPGALLRTKQSKDLLPKICRHAVQVKSGSVLLRLRCVRDRQGLPVIIREFRQPNGYIQVILIADTDYLFGAPDVCRRRR